MTDAAKRRRMTEIVAVLEGIYPEAVCALEHSGEPWRLMVMARLSAQCTDARVNEVCRVLFKKFPTLDALADAPLEEIADIVFIGKKIAVFCDSEFWHGYNWEERKKDFKSHQEFWIPKIERNMERDAEVTAKLESEGWTVIRFWGNEIKKNTAQCADIIEKAVHST